MGIQLKRERGRKRNIQSRRESEEEKMRNKESE